MKADTGTSFLDDAMQYVSLEARHFLADAMYCHLHNVGYQLEGNTEANDVDWFAKVIAQAERGGVPGEWNLLPDSTKELYQTTARAVLRALPAYQNRVAMRLISLSKVVMDIERAERKHKKGKR